VGAGRCPGRLRRDPAARICAGSSPTEGTVVPVSTATFKPGKAIKVGNYPAGIGIMP
jgi:hypothetical protein